MATITSFRHLIVYPAMMRKIERDWRAHADAADGDRHLSKTKEPRA